VCAECAHSGRGMNGAQQVAFLCRGQRRTEPRAPSLSGEPPEPGLGSQTRRPTEAPRSETRLSTLPVATSRIDRSEEVPLAVNRCEPSALTRDGPQGRPPAPSIERICPFVRRRSMMATDAPRAGADRRGVRSSGDRTRAHGDAVRLGVGELCVMGIDASVVKRSPSITVTRTPLSAVTKPMLLRACVKTTERGTHVGLECGRSPRACRYRRR